MDIAELLAFSVKNNLKCNFLVVDFHTDQKLEFAQDKPTGA